MDYTYKKLMIYDTLQILYCENLLKIENIKNCSGTTPKGARIQIQAGKLFHQWGEVFFFSMIINGKINIFKSNT